MWPQSGHGRRRPSPGKLLAIVKWEESKTITALRGFLGFTDYYSSYVEGYAHQVRLLQDLLKVGRKEGKAGRQKPIEFREAERQAFEGVKLKLQESLELYTVTPTNPSC